MKKPLLPIQFNICFNIFSTFSVLNQNFSYTCHVFANTTSREDTQCPPNWIDDSDAIVARIIYLYQNIMKKTIVITAAVVLAAVSYAIYSSNATCSGTQNCNACKNCKYCKNCAKEGGTCGVCK